MYKIQYIEGKLSYLENTEKLLKNYLYLDDDLNDLLNSITY